MRMIVPSMVFAVGMSLAAAKPCFTPEEAKAAAECATLGEAVTARLVGHSGGFGAWEVLVHMPNQEQGWRCLIGRDNGRVLKKEPIRNPPSKVR